MDRHVPLPTPSALRPPDGSRLFHGYVAKLGIAPLHEAPGRVRLSMPCAPGYLDEQGLVHVGALASIVDIAAVAASWSLVPRRTGARGSTIGMQVSFPGAAAEAVTADAHVHQRAEELLFSTVHVTGAGSGGLLALGQVSYRLLEPWPDAPTPR
jgi:acyl-coenzyme A thioesterase PaaI-like protein